MSDKTRIVVGGLEVRNGIHSILAADGKKYGFFETDQSKQFETNQYIQFRKLNVKAGDTLDIEFTPRTYINKFGKSIMAFNLDTMEKVTGQEATDAVNASDAKSLKVTIGKCATLFIQARLQGGANFNEVEQEIGQAVQVAVKLTDVIDDLFGEGEESRLLDTGAESGQQIGHDGKPVPF
jgi:hypothetical protein